MKVRTRALLVLAMIAALLATTSAAGAQDVEERQKDKTDAELTAEAQASDARIYADDYGISHEEAIRRLDRIDELRPVIAKLIESGDGRIAGIGFSHEADERAFVYLTGSDDPERSMSRLLDEHPDIVVRLGAQASLKELRALHRSDFIETVSKETGFRVVSSEIDQRNGQIKVAFDKAEGLTDRQLDNLATDLSERAAERLNVKRGEDRGIGLISVTVGVAATDTVQMEGGQVLDIDPDPAFLNYCTSGFGVRRTGQSYPKGLLTAAHCTSGSKQVVSHFHQRTANDPLPNPPEATVNPERNIVHNDSGDAMWYSLQAGGGDTVSDDFWATRYEERDVFYHENQATMMGDYVCMFGVRSYRGCGTVTSIDLDPNNCGFGFWSGCDDVWVKVEGPSLKTCVGDSGGPVFRNRRAYGIVDQVEGNNVCENGTQIGPDAIHFMAIDHVEDILNVTLLK